MALKAFKAITAAAILLTISSAASAQDDRQIGAWTLTDDGKDTCILYSLNDDGRFTSFLAEGETTSMGFFNKNLTDVVKNEERKLQIRIDDSRAIDVTGYGMVNDTAQGYMMFTPLTVFAENPVKGRFIIMRDGQDIHWFQLDDIRPAAQALIDCAKKYKK